MKPTRKTTLGTIAAAVTVVVVWAVGLGGLDVPAEVASAFTTIVTGVTVYFTTDGDTRPIEPAPAPHRVDPEDN